MMQSPNVDHGDKDFGNIEKNIDICECDCHKDGMQIMHFMPCCQMCGEKYINEDGTIDFVRVGQAIRKLNLKSK